MVLAFVFIAISIVANGFVAGMFFIFSVGGLSNPRGIKFLDRMVWVELGLLLGLDAGAVALGVAEHPVWGCLVPCASVPVLLFTLDVKRRALRGG